MVRNTKLRFLLEIKRKIIITKNAYAKYSKLLGNMEKKENSRMDGPNNIFISLNSDAFAILSLYLTR
jgi:hypothetical protein